jgi:glycosyltransferase involved in cell wall biosynthesis
MRRLKQEPRVRVLCNRPYMMDIANVLRVNLHCKVAFVLHYMPEMDEGNVLRKHYMPDFASSHDLSVFRQADVVVTLCEAGLDWLKGHGFGDKTVLIRNGVPSRGAASRGSSGAVFRFLFPGGTARHKGLDKIIPAIRQVAEKRRIEVIVLGDGDRMPDSAKDLPIRFVGFVSSREKIHRLYDKSHCVLFASTAEACSFAAIDALSFGLPIISTDVVGQREMLQGGAALLVEMKPDLTIDADEYARAMMRVIDERSLRLRLSASARARHLLRYTERRMLKDHLRLFKKLTGGD